MRALTFFFFYVLKYISKDRETRLAHGRAAFLSLQLQTSPLCHSAQKQGLRNGSTSRVCGPVSHAGVERNTLPLVSIFPPPPRTELKNSADNVSRVWDDARPRRRAVR